MQDISRHIQDWENLGTVLGIIGGICPDISKTLENHPRLHFYLQSFGHGFLCTLNFMRWKIPGFQYPFSIPAEASNCSEAIFSSLSFECRLAMASHIPRAFGTLCQRCPVFAALRRISCCLASSKKVSRRASRRNRPHHLGRD